MSDFPNEAGRRIPVPHRPYDGTALRSIGEEQECLDHVIVLDEVHLRRILGKYFDYYNATRCHLSLAGDAPAPRGVQGPELGEIVEIPEVGGLHHRYERARERVAAWPVVARPPA